MYNACIKVYRFENFSATLKCRLLTNEKYYLKLSAKHELSNITPLHNVQINTCFKPKLNFAKLI